MLAKVKSFIQNAKPFFTATFLFIVLGWILSGLVFSCSESIEEKRQTYRDIIGYWKEYIVHDKYKDETAIRKIVLNLYFSIHLPSSISGRI